jgi:hypothetical protein
MGRSLREKGKNVHIITRRTALKVGAMAGATGLLGGRLVRTAYASGAYSSVVLAKGPVGYWRLGEAAGPAATDVSGGGYDGSYLGNPAFAQPGAIVGDPDTAVGFNGPNSRDYVEIPDPTDGSQVFSQKTSKMGLTVELWMRPDVLTFPGETSDVYIHFLGKCASGQCEWGLRFYSQDSPTNPNRISAYIWNPGGGLGAGAGFTDELVAGCWIHVVGVYEPGDMNSDPPAGVHIYKKGVHRDGPPRSGTLYSSFAIVPVPGTAPVRLGTRSAVTNPENPAHFSYLTGGLDEVAIYPRVLSVDEIMENYTAGISPGSFSKFTSTSPRRVQPGPPVRTEVPQPNPSLKKPGP